MSSIPVRSSPPSQANTACNNSEGITTTHLLPLSISLAVSSSSLASNTYSGEEMDLFIPPGSSRDNRYNIPKYTSQFRESNIYRDSQISPAHHSGQIETDPIVLSRRQKQIDYGKNTQEYANYLKAVPVAERGPCHPKTPPLHRKYSRRAWDGLIKRWRLNLHCWTYPEATDVEFDDNGNYFFDLNAAPGKRHNESFRSEATSATSRSISTASSSPAASFSIFRDYEHRDYAGRLPLRNHLNLEQGEFKLFSPPSTRPSSSLCFAELRDEALGIGRINRQSSSEQDLTCSSTPRQYNPNPGQLNGTWWINQDYSHNTNTGATKNVESANDFFKFYFLKH